MTRLLSKIKALFRYLWVRLTLGKAVAQRDPDSNIPECYAIVTQFALDHIGKTSSPTLDAYVARCKEEHRTISADLVRDHLAGLAKAVKPLRDVVPLECVPPGGWPQERSNFELDHTRPVRVSFRDFTKPRHG